MYQSTTTKTHYHTVLVFHRGGRTCSKSFNNAITENAGEKYDQNQKAHLPTHFPTPLTHLRVKRKNPAFLPIVWILLIPVMLYKRAFPAPDESWQLVWGAAWGERHQTTRANQCFHQRARHDVNLIQGSFLFYLQAEYWQKKKKREGFTNWKDDMKMLIRLLSWQGWENVNFIYVCACVFPMILAL